MEVWELSNRNSTLKRETQSKRVDFEANLVNLARNWS
jgi:hypothetical protein